VKVVNADGTSVTGAQVTVTFFMPAMPSMGMAAMKTTAQLTESGAGNYEGRGELGSGGTWQVTITVTRNGAPLGRKQITINAEGGM
jgi:Cu(I)/Ag(I) efflux system membrane fusion protein/cobalt-zinc-cadmium efflux system membrane fusion protein